MTEAGIELRLLKSGYVTMKKKKKKKKRKKCTHTPVGKTHSLCSWVQGEYSRAVRIVRGRKTQLAAKH